MLKTYTACTSCLFLAIAQTLIFSSRTPYFFIQIVLLNFFILLGIYMFRGFQWDTRTTFEALFISILTGSLFGVLLAWFPLLFFHPDRLHTVWILFSFLLSVVGNPLLFFLAFKLFVKYFPGKRLLVIGKKKEIESLLKEVQEKSLGKINVFRYMNPSSIALERELDSPSEFDEILIADQQLANQVQSALERAHSLRIPVKYLPTLVEDNLQRIPLQLIEQFKDYYEIAFSKVNDSPTKRIYDLFLAFAALILSSPLLLLLCVLIFLANGLPIIFKQKRIGKDLIPFVLHKFRTLTNLSAESLDKMKDPNDTIEQRVTKIGKMLRISRVDEIPQFVDVLKGNMSAIGPRPEMENYHDMCMKKIPFYRFRYKLKPGITGWAQIHYKHTSTLEDYQTKTEYDLYYIKNRTLLLDLQITLKTIETMLGFRSR